MLRAMLRNEFVAGMLRAFRCILHFGTKEGSLAISDAASLSARFPLGTLGAKLGPHAPWGLRWGPRTIIADCSQQTTFDPTICGRTKEGPFLNTPGYTKGCDAVHRKSPTAGRHQGRRPRAAAPRRQCAGDTTGYVWAERR